MRDIKAFILAAGYGERLRPVTDHLPKPLLPLLGNPVIETVLEKLARLPVKSFGINIHHKAEMLRRWAADCPYSDKIELFFEEKILGTGGALKNAEEYLGSSFFIVHNADILSDIDLERLVNSHLSSGRIATLAVHDYEMFNNVLIDESGRFCELDRKGTVSAGLCKVAFTGIAIYSPEFLELLPEGNSSVVDAWTKAASSGREIGTVKYSDCSWNDIGTPSAYVAAVHEVLGKCGEAVFVHPSADCSRTEVRGYAVFESGVFAGAGTYVRDSVLLPGTRVPEGAALKGVLAGPGYVIDLHKDKGTVAPHFSVEIIEKFFGGTTTSVESTLIGTGGSDRKYYRLEDARKSAVLMVCSNDDPDYDRHILYTDFFRRHSLPVPRIHLTDNRRKQALFEDLGDVSLYTWLKCRRGLDEIEQMYRKVLDISVILHSTVPDNIADCPMLGSRVFDREHLRWETSYFIEKFAFGLLRIRTPDQEIVEEFNMIAAAVDAFPKGVVHRDFQSQNIMITGSTPRLIDYQGARIGPPAYDLASILWDPYFNLDGTIRERLIRYYMDQRRSAGHFDPESFRHSLLLCRLQRHMQALGAYGFLSVVKGKKYFLKHVPQALKYLLSEASEVSDQYPLLFRLVSKISASYPKAAT